jgi:hypothetical protein
MDGLLRFVLFCGLGLLAVRYGGDSRDTLRSDHENLTCRDAVWDDAVSTWRGIA